MKNKTIITMLMTLGLSLALAGAVWAQAPTPLSFTIVGTDGVSSDSVVIGLQTGATDSIDSGIDGPELSPAGPVGVFDFRAIDQRSPYRDLLGQGVRKDYRAVPPSQVLRDTFKLAYRSSTEGATSFTISWPEGLELFGGGERGWMLADGSGLPIPAFQPIDMTKQFTFNVPAPTAGSFQYVYIIIGDGKQFRSFRADSIALAKDSKGKYGKAEKRKNAISEWDVTFTNRTGAPDATSLTVKFSQNVTSIEVVSPAGWATITSLPAKELTFTGPALAADEDLTVSGFGDKGKSIKAKGEFDNGEKVSVVADPGSERLGLKMPNLNNIGFELYPKGGTPLLLGQTGSINAVSHASWKDVIKSLNKKGTIHTSAPGCFDLFKTKPFKKALKSYPPDKQQNLLVGEGIGLKFNINASAGGNTPSGFGQLRFKASPGDRTAFDGRSVSQIAESLDSYLSNCGGVLTATEMLTVLQTINNSFGGTFYKPEDTLSYGAGVTVASPMKPVLFSENLYRDSADVSLPPITRPVTPYAENVPDVYELNQNYPNPFNPSTTIEFSLAKDAIVTLKIYNTLGQEVATLVNREQLSEGSNEVEFDATNFSTGIYYYRIVVNSGEFQQVRKMMLIK